MTKSPADITQLLQDWRLGDENALAQLTSQLYEQLRALAGHHLRKERAADSLRPTALVNEALMKLLGAQANWQDRKHFVGVASHAMRQVLVEHARRRNREKRGAGVRPVTLKTGPVGDEGPNVDLLDLHRAIEALAEQDERKAQIVELIYFGGLTYDEVADVMELSKVTVHRELSFSKAWLKQALTN